MSQWFLEVKDFLKKFAKITLQGKQGKGLKRGVG
jgi:hypothetical protein